MSIQLSTRVMHIKDETTGSYDTVDILKGSGIDDVQVNGTSVVEDGVADIPVSTSSDLGVVKTNYMYGVGMISASNPTLCISPPSSAQIKPGTEGRKPIVPFNQHEAVFYGLAKAAGDATQSASDNAVGTYTNEAKAAIKSMIGVIDPTVTDVQINGTSVVSQGVADIPTSSGSGSGRLGVVKPGNGMIVNETTGSLSVNPASDTQVKNSSDWYRPLVPSRQDASTFYGLAKAASDTTQSASSNAVGTYTDQAKIAIQKMLGIYEAPWELIREDTVTNTTETAIDITVDGNGQPFELTDVIIIVQVTPIADVGGSISDYGRIFFRNGNTVKNTAYCTGGQSATFTSVNVCTAEVTQNNGLTKIEYTEFSGTSNHVTKRITNMLTIQEGTPYKVASTIYDNIRISAVKGTIQYRVIGRRKWQ